MARLAFLGTPEVAADVLRALVSAGHDVAVVVSGSDRRRGRGGTLMPSPVKAAALELGLAVSASPDEVLAAGVDLAVVVAYGRLLKPPLLGGVELLNLHFSLLPRWRGAAPVERAILAGDAEAGVCLMSIDAGLDTGPVYECRSVPVGDEETAMELRSRLAALGTELLLARLADLPASLGSPVPQQGEPTYAPKIDPAELLLDWARDAASLHRVVRVGRAQTTWRGSRLFVHRARVVEAPVPAPAAPPGTLVGPVVTTGAGGLELLEVQAEGRARQTFRDWANGARPRAGERLGEPAGG
jgi:methionyl-tRNA formyltransferase